MKVLMNRKEAVIVAMLLMAAGMLMVSLPSVLFAGQIDTTGAHISSSAYDIGHPQNCFDNDIYSLMRSPGVSPAFVQIGFDEVVTANEVRVLVGQADYPWAEKNVWWLEAADNEQDLAAKEGSYELIAPVRNRVSGAFDRVRLPHNVSKRIWRFTVDQQVGTNHVHIAELQLWYDEQAEYNPFGEVDVADGRISADSFDIGRPTNCFDGDTSTLVRSAGVNPFTITISFPRAKDVTRAEVYLGQPGYAWAESDSWKLVGADSEEDLDSRKGSYQVVVPARYGVADRWDVGYANRTVSKKMFRFIISRTVGDDYVHVPELKLFNDVQPPTQTLLVLINSAISSALSEELNLYSDDLEHEGYATIIHEYTGNGNDPEAIKNIIRQYYAQEENMVGVFLIGDIPFARTVCNWDGPQGYADLFYMELDGNWSKINNVVYSELRGDRNPEIYAGRLFGRTLVHTTAQEIELYRDYLSRNHFYRRGYTQRTHNVLFFTQDTQLDRHLVVDNLLWLYPSVTEVNAHNQSVRNHLMPELGEDYEYIHISTHSSTTRWGDLGYQDVMQMQPTALFYNTHSSNTARFTSSYYIGGVTVLHENALFYIGSTTYAFYTPEMDIALTSALAVGATVGEALMDLFDHRFDVSPEASLRWKGQELIILGDPTLRVR